MLVSFSVSPSWFYPFTGFQWHSSVLLSAVTCGDGFWSVLRFDQLKSGAMQVDTPLELGGVPTIKQSFETAKKRTVWSRLYYWSETKVTYSRKWSTPNRLCRHSLKYVWILYLLILLVFITWYWKFFSTTISKTIGVCCTAHASLRDNVRATYQITQYLLRRRLL